MGRFGTTVKNFSKESIRATSAHEASSNSLENFALSVVTVCALLVVGLSCQLAAPPAHAKKAVKTKDVASPSTDTPSSSSAPAPVKESAYPAIDSMEKFLFFRIFYDEDAETRLTRLDKEVFGDPNEGSVEERMAKLDTVLAPKMKAKDDEQERAKAEAEAASAAAAAAAKPAPAAPQQSEAELAAERARIAAQAAREQEIKGLLSEAANHWRAKKGPEALERFEQVLRLDPQNSEAQFSMGVIEESRGKLNQALGRYEQAAKIDPDNPDFSEAIAAIQKKIKSGGAPPGPQGDAKRLRDSATLAFKSGEYFSALDLYKQLDEKVPNQALTKYNIGSIYLMLKDHYNALDYYQQAHKLDGSDERFTKAYNDLAAEMKKTRGALEENKKTAEAEWNPPAGAGNQLKSPKKGKDKTPQPNPQQGGRPSNKVATNPGYQQSPYQQQPRQYQPPQQQPSQQQYQQPPQQQYQQPPQQQYQQPPQQQYQQPPQ
ncbi:MAG: tetratricopeptide repeat protein, partial [Candidatus Obscuribacterales bacterium]|nr:tetratricopeptide repeat protein [Candidatus Obscuribacterales bacterium]